MFFYKKKKTEHVFFKKTLDTNTMKSVYRRYFRLMNWRSDTDTIADRNVIYKDVWYVDSLMNFLSLMYHSVKK